MMQLTSLDTVLGVELNMVGDNLFSCRFCVLSKKQQVLNIISKKVIEGPLATVIAALPKDYPVALTLAGKGIIHKNLQVAEDTAPNQIFQTAFPSVEQKDFYVQQYNQQHNFLVSIIRKQATADLLDKLKRAGLKIYILSLGGILTAQIWSQLNSYDTNLLFDGHSFAFTSDGQFAAYSYQPAQQRKFPIKIEQEVIPEENVVAYAAAFQLILHDKLSIINANAEVVNTQFADFLAGNKLKKKALVFLFVLFGLLMFSFLMFSYYNQENAKLTQQVGAQTANADQTDLMKKTIAENEQLLKQLNWNGGYNYGFILNEIGQSTPKQLQLNEIVMNEYKTDAEKMERVPSIKITGNTANLTAVNNWIFVLKEKSWIKSVKLLKYLEDPETELYQFNIAITY